MCVSLSDAEKNGSAKAFVCMTTFFRRRRRCEKWMQSAQTTFSAILFACNSPLHCLQCQTNKPVHKRAKLTPNRQTAKIEKSYVRLQKCVINALPHTFYNDYLKSLLDGQQRLFANCYLIEVRFKKTTKRAETCQSGKYYIFIFNSKQMSFSATKAQMKRKCKRRWSHGSYKQLLIRLHNHSRW